jgi:hypothetical protein
MVDPTHEGSERRIARPPDHCEGSLGGGREKGRGRQDAIDLLPPPETGDSGQCEDGRVDLSRTDEADPGVDVPPNFDDSEVRPPTQELGAAAETARTDPRAAREPRRSSSAGEYQTIPGVRPGRTRQQVETCAQLDRKVLCAVNRKVDRLPK